MQQRRFWPVAFMGCALIASCSGADSTGPEPPVDRIPTSIQLSQVALSIDDGREGQLTATVFDQHGVAFATLPTAMSILWSSSADSIASVTGTGQVMGQRPGQAQVSATLSPGGMRASASVHVRQVASALVRLDGDAQFGAMGTALPGPISVRVADRHGDGVAGVTVSMSVTSGGGTVASASIVTSGSGEAQTTWTLGPTEGEQTMSVTAPGLTGSPLLFTATATSPRFELSAVSPDPVIRGQSVTITGSGFHSNPANNRVTVGGIEVPVAVATATSLEFVMPDDCLPSKEIDFQVFVAGVGSNILRRMVRPVQFLDVSQGQQLVLAGSPCLQFDETDNTQSYLIGVQSTSEILSSITPARISATTATPAAPSNAHDPGAARPSPAVDGHPQHPLSGVGLASWDAHAAAEQRLRHQERTLIEPLVPQSLPYLRSRQRSLPVSTPTVAAVPATAQVGDTLAIRVANFQSTNFCTNFTSVVTVVRTIGVRGIFLEDVANPPNGFTASHFNELSTFLDEHAYASVTEHFGDPTDIDGNQRIVIVATREVNRAGFGGFVVSGDLVGRASCPASNEGEYYYAQVPDPTGTLGQAASLETVLRNTKRLLPHELTHIVQFGRRMAAGIPGFLPAWILEGQATLAEEVTGHRIGGHEPGTNLGREVAFNTPPTMDVNWYGNAFIYMAFYYGFQSRTARVETAPEACSPFGGARQGLVGLPCGNPNFAFYGPSWLFLRWLSDHHGSRFAGGERELHTTLITQPQSGLAGLSTLVNQPVATMLAQWAAMQYVDGLVPDLEASLTLPSWNMDDVMRQAVTPNARLTPRERSFSSFTDELSIRAGSSAYFLLSGDGRPGTAVRVTGPGGGSLPADAQVWIVRLR
jgi:hypothetical protein